MEPAGCELDRVELEEEKPDWTRVRGESLGVTPSGSGAVRAGEAASRDGIITRAGGEEGSAGETAAGVGAELGTRVGAVVNGGANGSRVL
jgi:hypothetical protein